ncbi:DUF4209 domain-containing protein [Hymenobacter sp. 5516J-16]|uniref:DUF4209 domain-containing protein n=1 Tax=Hymenobacter sp. 5516J-16 TaxID=2932253 RepID=UPI001FD38C85|nr:DUF4209 domain-containing protein [Hymenobacter sp. 5516J-16]UOQ76546.1 DUF4209 domain-containing protein [Hymenobacter sp. 5516J-16]
MSDAYQAPQHFATLTELAHFLDNNCEDWNLRMRDRDLLSVLETATVPAELLPNLQAEKVGLSVWFKGCTVQRESSYTDEVGQTWGSALPQELEPLPFSYYQQRLEHSTNPYLQARYALLLWNAPKPFRHIRYAQSALDHLLSVLVTHAASTREARRDCLDLLHQACALASTVRHREADTAAAVLERYSGTIPFERNSRPALLRLIAEYSKLFRTADQERILRSTRELYAECYAAADYFACESICKEAAPYAQSLNRDPREWHQLLGQAYEGEANHRLADDDASFIVMEFYSRAAKAYQLASNPTAEADALRQAQAFKPKLKLSNISIDFTAEQTQLLLDDVKRHTTALLECEPSAIFDFLANYANALPDYSSIKSQAEQEPLSFMSMISVVHIDDNKNTSRADISLRDKGDDNETEEARRRRIDLHQRIRRSYSLGLSLRLQYLIPLFIEGYQAGRITYEAFCQYLDAHSWVAQTLTEHDISGNEVRYTWQPMLYPSLREFFTQLHIFIHEGPESASFVLCIDSLTLKIEGLLREVLQRMGAHTLATHKRHDLREVFFDDLLDLATAKSLLNDSEAYYFRYVFTPLGRNLRNNVAHNYYHLPERYSLKEVILLLTALLRLTGFRLVPAEEAQSNIS